MNKHELKTWPQYFDAVRSEAKTFEIRKNDRDFQVGDQLDLFEWDPEMPGYTGEHLRVYVTYITDFEQQPGNVVMGITFIKP